MNKLKKNIGLIVPFLGLVLVLVVLGIATGGRLFEMSNLSRIIDQCYTIVILSVGCSFIYAHGGFDLSVGAVYGLAQVVAGYIMIATENVWLALPVCLAISLICSLVTGGVTVKLALPAFISSLCMQFLCRGIITATTKNNLLLPAGVSSTENLANNWVFKTIVLVIILAIAYILMHHTVFGRNNRFVGENPAAAQQSGINVTRTRMLAYTLNAIFVGIASFFAMCRTGTVAILAGNGYELDVIVAIVLGGMSLNGGINSSVRAPILGALITTVLANGLVMLGVDYIYIDAVSGIIFLAVIAVSYKRIKNGLLAR